MTTFIDLFAGIGGFRLALERHGLPCVFSSEIDDYARKAYWANFAEYPAGDITAIDAKDVPAHDVLCAGFPCQSFSLSGFRQGLKDERGELFFEISRIARHHKPSVLLLENVEGLTNIDGGKILERIVGELKAIGYAVHYDVLNASFYGIPQARKRLYFVCLHKNSGLTYKPPLPTYEEVYLKDVLEDAVADEFYIKETDITWRQDNQLTLEGGLKLGLNLAGYTGDQWLKSADSGRQKRRIHYPNGHAATLTTQADYSGNHSGRYAVKKGVRKLTPLECKRIMGFPDDFILGDPEPFSNEQQYKLLGNAVIPKMIELIYGGICQAD